MCGERTNDFDGKIIAENKRIPLLGLTGSMAAGKSTVSAMLAERGFFIVDADKTAHDVIQTEKVLRKLTDAFGEGILDESGNIDRKKLSVCVFGEKKNEVQNKTCPGNAENASAERIAAEKKSRVEPLNDIVHPAVIESLFEQAETAKQLPDCPGVVLDVPLLIESGLHKRCDSVILVTANIETRYARIMKRDGLSRREARARIAAQMPQWKKKRYADYIIENDTTEQLVRLVDGKIWECKIPSSDLVKWERALKLINLRNEADGTTSIRYLSDQAETPDSVSAVPRLEDLYLWLFPQEGEVRL